jgi:hypothetical protein
MITKVQFVRPIPLRTSGTSESTIFQTSDDWHIESDELGIHLSKGTTHVTVKDVGAVLHHSQNTPVKKAKK